MSMGSLAVTYWNQGRWEEAGKLFVLSFDTQRIVLANTSVVQYMIVRSPVFLTEFLK